MHPPYHAAHSAVEVPYLGVTYEEFGDLPFDEIPTARSFNPILALKGVFPGVPPAEVEPFVQAWLHLGLLIEVLNQALGFDRDVVCTERLTSQDFIHSSETADRQVISTRSL